MKYLNSRFSVGMGGEKYGSGWERTFGKKEPEEEKKEKDVESESVDPVESVESE